MAEDVNSLYQQLAAVQQVGGEDNSPSKLLVPLTNKNIQVSQFALVDTRNIIKDGQVTLLGMARHRSS